MSIYQSIITRQLGKLKRSEVDPRHVEAFMRNQYGALDHLDRRTFNREVKLAVGAIDADPSIGEPLAQSYGLRKNP
jgi:hypothetical protein